MPKSKMQKTNFVAVQPGSYSAKVFDFVPVDPSSGNAAITLPPNAAAGDYVDFRNQTSDMTGFTITATGVNLESPSDGSSVVGPVTIQGAFAGGRYMKGASIWHLVQRFNF